MLCVPCFSSLSIEECHNILPCKRTLRPSQNRTCGFPTSGSSAKLTHRTIVCKHTIHATRSIPAKNIVAFLPSPLRYEANFASVMLSISAFRSLLTFLSWKTPTSRLGALSNSTAWEKIKLRYVADRWRMDYNHYRWYNPDASGDYMAPAAFAATCLKQGCATLRLHQGREYSCEILS